MGRGPEGMREPVLVWVMLASSLLLGVALPSHGASRQAPRAAEAVAMPGPARRAPSSDRVGDNEECVACHPEVAAQWEGSLHQQAFVDPHVELALTREPRPFCRSCHAPEGDPKAAPYRQLRENGKRGKKLRALYTSRPEPTARQCGQESAEA